MSLSFETELVDTDIFKGVLKFIDGHSSSTLSTRSRFLQYKELRLESMTVLHITCLFLVVSLVSTPCISCPFSFKEDVSSWYEITSLDEIGSRLSEVLQMGQPKEYRYLVNDGIQKVRRGQVYSQK